MNRTRFPILIQYVFYTRKYECIALPNEALEHLKDDRYVVLNKYIYKDEPERVGIYYDWCKEHCIGKFGMGYAYISRKTEVNSISDSFVIFFEKDEDLFKIQLVFGEDFCNGEFESE